MGLGTYEEVLPCGGSLIVTKNSWQIRYYFPGPDSRHKGTFVTIPGASIESYISAFNDNWCEYEKLKGVIPSGADFSKPGKMGMVIRIGLFSEGVCIQAYHMPIKSRDHLEKVTSSYRYASERALQAQQFLARL